jgi:hypothetical protein
MTNAKTKHPLTAALFVALAVLFLVWIARDGYAFGSWLKSL